MRNNVLILKKSCCIYNGIIMEFGDLNNVKQNSYNKLKIIILEQPLIINEISHNIKKDKIQLYAQNLIENDFPQNNEILYNFDYDLKREKIYIYYIRSKIEINRLCLKFNNINIMPIQYFMLEACINKYKKEMSFVSVSYIDNIYYFIEVKNRIITDNLISKDFESIRDKALMSSNEVLIIMEFSDFTIDTFNKFKFIGNKHIKIININCEKEKYAGNI